MSDRPLFILGLMRAERAGGSAWVLRLDRDGRFSLGTARDFKVADLATANSDRDTQARIQRALDDFGLASFRYAKRSEIREALEAAGMGVRRVSHPAQDLFRGRGG